MDWSYEVELEGIQIFSLGNADEKSVILNRLHGMTEFRTKAPKKKRKPFSQPVLLRNPNP